MLAFFMVLLLVKALKNLSNFIVGSSIGFVTAVLATYSICRILFDECVHRRQSTDVIDSL
jgi:ABC-type methionine transport system permease subunit